MKKICFLLGNYFKYFKGGAELQAYFIAKKLSKEIEIHYFFVKPPNFKKKNFQRIDEGIILHPMKQHNYNKFGKFFFLNYWELLKSFNEIKPNLVYQRGGKPYAGIVAQWCKKNNKKLVLGISMETNCIKSSIFNLNYNFFSYLSNIVDGFFTFTGIKKADLIIAQNHRQQKLLHENFNQDSIIIPNGHPIPLPPFKKADPPIISWIANIKMLKQPEIFIKLAENLQDLNAQFVYAGRPAQGLYHNMLMEKTKKLTNLKYLGEISFEKTNELLSESSVFINSSLHEGFPNTYIQAWMRKTPVVALNSDPDDLLKTEKIGFHSTNFEQLTEDVKFLIENVKERNAMGKRARKYAVENHDIEKIGKQYMMVFEKLFH